MAQEEGKLLKRARGARRMTVKDAADAANMSFQNWGRIERGEATSVPDDTLAHAAHAVGVLPEELDQIGRTEAAEILRMVNRRLDAPVDDDDLAQELAELRESMIARFREMEERIRRRRQGESGQPRQTRQEGSQEGKVVGWSETNRKAQ